MGKDKGKGIIRKPDVGRVVSGHSGRLAQVILNVDLRNGHEGLLEIARKAGVDIDKLPVGHYVCFVNPQLNRFKIMTLAPNRRGTIIAYYKQFEGRIERETIQSLPQAFGVSGDGFYAGRELGEKLDEKLKYQRVPRRVRELN